MLKAKATKTVPAEGLVKERCELQQKEELFQQTPDSLQKVSNL